MAKISTVPSTISDALGIGPLLLLLLLATIALAIVIDDGRPQVPACQEDELIVGTGDFHGDTAGWDAYECVNTEELVAPAAAAPAIRTYCVGGTLITVLEAGKRAGGSC